MESGQTDIQGQMRLQESLSQKKRKREKNNLIMGTLTKKVRTLSTHVNSKEPTNKLGFQNANLHKHIVLHRAPFAQHTLPTETRMQWFLFSASPICAKLTRGQNP